MTLAPYGECDVGSIGGPPLDIHGSVSGWRCFVDATAQHHRTVMVTSTVYRKISMFVESRVTAASGFQPVLPAETLPSQGDAGIWAHQSHRGF